MATKNNKFAAMMRSVNYLREIRVEKNRLHVRKTGARIKLDMSFFRNAISVIEIYAYLVAVRMSRLVKGRRPVKNICFFPQSAAPWYNIWSVTQLAGLKVTDDPLDADYVFIFDDNTYTNAASHLPEGVNAALINHRCANISKQYVAELFREVFGYDLGIDPTTWQGKAARKSQINGTHDGAIIECPIAPEDVLPGYAYQKLINCSDDGETTEDLRAAIVLGQIPLIFHKFKDAKKRFGTDYLHVDVRQPEDVFSPEEIALIIDYCAKAGLDFGTVDIMRDRDDGRLYLVDVNKTCMPVLTLPFGKQIEAFRRISHTFRDRLPAVRPEDQT